MDRDMKDNGRMVSSMARQEEIVGNRILLLVIVVLVVGGSGGANGVGVGVCFELLPVVYFVELFQLNHVHCLRTVCFVFPHFSVQ